MTVRSFVDESGAVWEVREIHVPTLSVVPKRYLPHPEYADGWLLFSNDRERRRLAPFPREWERLASLELIRLCTLAIPARERGVSPFAPNPLLAVDQEAGARQQLAE